MRLHRRRAQAGEDGGARYHGRSVHAESSRWHWLLALPVVLPLLTFLYDSEEPALFGIPFFYWVQLLFCVLSSATVTLVYLLTRSGR